MDLFPLEMPVDNFYMGRFLKNAEGGEVYVCTKGTPADQMKNEANFLTLYREEGGEQVPVTQPVILNQVGLPVVDGNVVNILCPQEYALAVYDAYGEQQFYFPSVTKYDLYAASKIPLEGGGNLQQAIITKTPQQFGAKGDGVTDDTAAIQRAMNYCQLEHAKLIFPSAKYLISRPLLYKNLGFYNYEIEGQGGNVEICLTTSEKTGITAPDPYGVDVNVNAAIVILTDTNQSKYSRISGIRFTTTANADYAIYASITENNHIHDCFFEGFKFGIFDKGSWINRIERCIARNMSNTGFYMEGGTSTYLKECYVDHAERGYYLAAGYSSIQNCACDHTTRWSYVFGGGSGDNATTDTRGVSMMNCGSENSGRGSAIYIDGRVALGVTNYHAGNYPPYQNDRTPYLVDVSSRGVDSQITMSNVRCVNFEWLINDASSRDNYFHLTNVTSRSDLVGKYSLAQGSKVLEMTKEGIRIITKEDAKGIGIVNGDIVDSNTSSELSGLRNNQYIMRKGLAITRESGSTGSVIVELPMPLKDGYRVVATFDGGPGALASIAPIFGVDGQTNNSFRLTCASAKGNETWTTIGVDLIIYGVKLE